jgi:hypothetical protein
MQQPHVSTYAGMNKDYSPDSNPPEFYIDALDMRITTVTGASNAAVLNIKGNTKVTDIPLKEFVANIGKGRPFFTGTFEDVGEGVVIGATNIRETVILFVTIDHSTKGGYGKKYLITLKYMQEKT